MPTAIVDLDVDTDAHHVECGERYERAFVVVRRRGVPIAQRLVPLERGRLRPAEVLGPLHLALAAGAAPEPASRSARSATVAVCTHERPDYLARCLDAVRALDGDPDVLVVDSGPTTSRTADVVRAVPGVRYTAESRRGLNRAVHWFAARCDRPARLSRGTPTSRSRRASPPSSMSNSILSAASAESIPSVAYGSLPFCALNRMTCGSINPTARPCTIPNRAVSGLAQACAAPSIDFSMAAPARCAPAIMSLRAAASFGMDNDAA